MKVVEYQGTEVVIDATDWRQSTRLKVQIFGCFMLFTLFGLAEQTLGTIIPKLEAHYHLNDFTMSITYVVVMSGYFLMAAVNEVTHKYTGVRGVATGGVSCLCFAYFVISLRPPYPIFLMVHLFVGLGFGGLDAGINGWMGQLTDANQLLGILHGCYGLGCMILPPLVTFLIHNTNWRWYDYYLVLATCASFTLLVTLISFRYETPAKFAYLQYEKHAKKVEENGGDELAPVTVGDVARLKMAWMIAISLFLYVGGEVAFGQWLVSFLLRVKDFPYALALWMATCFWTGLTAGRMILGFVTAHYFTSEVKANWVYILGLTLGFATFLLIQAIAAERNTMILGLDFVTVFLTGFITGPIFPSTIMSVYDLIPVRFHTSGMGVICAFGGGGGAVVPFLVGLVSRSSNKGLSTMPTIITCVFIALSALWSWVYTHKRVKV